MIVTGSNRRIGLKLVKQYAANDLKVIATSRAPGDDVDLQALASSHAHVTIKILDVTNTAQISALADEMRDVPIVV